MLYALFVFSVFCPIYTYVLYPLILKCLTEKSNIIINYNIIERNTLKSHNEFITVIVIGKNGKTKADTIKRTGIDAIWADQITESINKTAKGKIILFTDDKAQLDEDAITEIIKPFADERIGCVVGQQTNPEGNSMFWKYENIVKRLESRFGCVSGVTASIFAVRKKDLPIVPDYVLNKPFYIATAITQAGKVNVYQPSAIAYERKTGGINFDKHVQEATGYWQALRLFFKMLLPINKGNFVYISHRVMKWFVWLNMILIFIISGVLASDSEFMASSFYCQVITYLVVLLLGRKTIYGILGKALSSCYYFIMLNVSYFLGLFKLFGW